MQKINIESPSPKHQNNDNQFTRKTKKMSPHIKTKMNCRKIMGIDLLDPVLFFTKGKQEFFAVVLYKKPNPLNGVCYKGLNRFESLNRDSLESYNRP